MSITITLSKEQATDLHEALDHLGLDMQCRLPDAETTDPDDVDIAEQCKRTYDISQHVMALIDAEQKKFYCYKAAPELLEVLEEVVMDIEDYCEDHNSDRPTDVTVVLPRLKAAIAKAKGGE